MIFNFPLRAAVARALPQRGSPFLGGRAPVKISVPESRARPAASWELNVRPAALPALKACKVPWALWDPRGLRGFKGFPGLRGAKGPKVPWGPQGLPGPRDPKEPRELPGP